MAVIQISRIQHRRGLADELPDALAEGEIGFATDSGEVFIGAPSNELVANRKAYPYQNIKILTEFDIQRSISGDVYYHGPLKRYLIPTVNPLNVALFNTNNATYGIYDFSITTTDAGADDDIILPEGAPIQVGTLIVCGDKTSPALSMTAIGQDGQDFTNAGVTIKAVDAAADPLDPDNAGKILVMVTATPDSATGGYQIALNIINGPATFYRFHISGREWLASKQT